MDELLRYILIFIGLLVAELIYFRVAAHYGIVDRPSERGSSTRVTLRGGGIIFFIGVIAYAVIYQSSYWAFFVGLTAVALVSFIDDVHSLPPKVRLLTQLTALALLLWQIGLFSQSYWIWIPVALFVCGGIINIFNFMDGINGITGGYALVIIASLIYVEFKVVDFVSPSFLIVTMLSVLVFCFFNFRKTAKCFAGDVGSVSIAFILLFFMGLLVMKTHDFSWFIFMVVYGVDGVLTIFHRIMMHEKLTQPHRNHAYQIMANELAIPHTVVSLLYLALQALACVIYFWQPGYLTFLAFIIIYSIAYVIFMSKFFYLHKRAIK
ncbi:MAG: MraY family glycosyltransferase [Prevotella sp.]